MDQTEVNELLKFLFNNALECAKKEVLYYFNGTTCTRLHVYPDKNNEDPMLCKLSVIMVSIMHRVNACYMLCNYSDPC